MLLWVMDVEFENTCTVPGKLNVSSSISRLPRWVKKALKGAGFIAEDSLVVMIADPQIAIRDQYS